jgi:hypothetical protein
MRSKSFQEDEANRVSVGLELISPRVGDLGNELLSPELGEVVA